MGRSRSSVVSIAPVVLAGLFGEGCAETQALVTAGDRERAQRNFAQALADYDAEQKVVASYDVLYETNLVDNFDARLTWMFGTPADQTRFTLGGRFSDYDGRGTSATALVGIGF